MIYQCGIIKITSGKGRKLLSKSVDIIQRPKLGGHGKFVFRHGWFKKGYDLINQDPQGFFREDAYIQLGVGKNMAESIRYWVQAVDILEEKRDEQRSFSPTRLGKAIFGESGFDPYLEQYDTLWLLHWQLSQNINRGLVYHIAFSKLYDNEFRKHNLIELLSKELPRYGVSTTEKMIERETDVFLRTYVPARTKTKASIEESLDCPLADLNLISFIQSDDVYRFRIGPKNTLSLKIFGYCFVKYIKEIAKNRRTTGIDEIIYSAGSPGQIFKLDENSVMEYLENIEKLTNGAILLQETAGIRQIYLHNFNKLDEFRILEGEELF